MNFPLVFICTVVVAFFGIGAYRVVFNRKFRDQFAMQDVVNKELEKMFRPVKKDLQVMRSPFSFMPNRIRAAKDILQFAEEVYDFSSRLKGAREGHLQFMDEVNKNRHKTGIVWDLADQFTLKVVEHPVGRIAMEALQFLTRNSPSKELLELYYAASHSHR